jgi:putative spermidine/putrescine transport system permease protein
MRRGRHTMADLARPSPGIRAMGWLVFGFLILPALVVIPVSFTDTRFLSLPQHGLSLQHWARLFASADWMDAAWNSLSIAVLSTLLAVSAGTLCAIGCWRINSRLTNMMRSAMLVPLMIPTIVYALGIYRVFVDLDLVGTVVGVVLAHAVSSLPFVVLTVSASLAGLDRRLEQAARNLGASMLQTIRMVIIPSIMPGILSGAIFAFIHSWDELVIVIFIGGRALFTLPRRIWDGVNDNLDPTIAAVATFMIGVTLLLLLLELALRERRARLISQPKGTRG